MRIFLRLCARQQIYHALMDGGGGSAINSMVDPHSHVKNKNVKNERKKKIASAQDAGVLDMSDVPVL